MKQFITYEEAYQLLSYDPETGRFVWRVDTPRAKAGDPAGTATALGYWVLTIKGHKVPAQYIAHLLHTGQWPAERLTLKNHRDPALTREEQYWTRRDMRWENIVPYARYLSDSPEAAKRRHYEKTRISRRQEHERYLQSITPTTYPNVGYDRDNDQWLTFAIPSLEEERSPFYQAHHHNTPAKPVGWFKHQADAERYAQQLYQNRAYIQDDKTKGDKPPEPLPPGAGAARAGFKGPTLDELTLAFAYDDERGVIFYRTGDKRYENAAQPSTGKTSFVMYRNWRLPAHALAWFLAMGVWPNRGTIHPIDGDWRNLKLYNLRYDYAHLMETADAE